MLGRLGFIRICTCVSLVFRVNGFACGYGSVQATCSGGSAMKTNYLFAGNYSLWKVLPLKAIAARSGNFSERIST